MQEDKEAGWAVVWWWQGGKEVGWAEGNLWTKGWWCEGEL